MTIRFCAPMDRAAIEKLHESYDFPWDNNHALYEMVVEDDGKVVGYGLVRPIIEAVMVLDQDLPKRKKILAFEALHRQATVRTALARFDQLHAFVSGSFSRILKKHFGYRTCKGEALVREVL